jgi:hypothetical protein
MRKFHSIATLRGDGLRPELQALFDRFAIDPRSVFLVRDDGMVQAGPDPASGTALTQTLCLFALTGPPAVADAARGQTPSAHPAHRRGQAPRGD